jgi:hypothetical protein
MMMEVMVREGYNAAGKQKVFPYRVHENELPAFLRKVQDEGGYIITVRKLVVMRAVYPAYDDVRYDVRYHVKEKNDTHSVAQTAGNDR